MLVTAMELHVLRQIQVVDKGQGSGGAGSDLNPALPFTNRVVLCKFLNLSVP